MSATPDWHRLPESEITEALRERDALRAEAKRLREALTWIVSANAAVTDSDYRKIAMQFARDALAPVRR